MSADTAGQPLSACFGTTARHRDTVLDSVGLLMFSSMANRKHGANMWPTQWARNVARVVDRSLAGYAAAYC